MLHWSYRLPEMTLSENQTFTSATGMTEVLLFPLRSHREPHPIVGNLQIGKLTSGRGSVSVARASLQSIGNDSPSAAAELSTLQL